MPFLRNRWAMLLVGLSLTTLAAAATVTLNLGDVANFGGSSYLVGPGPTLTLIPPVPVPVNTLNVRSFGAKGDGVSDDTASCQKTLNAAVAGSKVYFPAGVYRLTDQLKWGHPPKATLIGDGPTSVLRSVGGQGLYIGTGGESGGPVTVTKVKFQGNPGTTQTAGNGTGGIMVYGPNGTVIDNVDFQDVTQAVFDAGPVGISSGATINNCRVNSWARIGLFLNGGETVSGCTLTQNDPNVNGHATSHGIYSHASGITIKDTVVSGARKYGCQIYSEDLTHAMDNVTMLRDQFLGCHDGGVTLDHSQMGAGDIHNFLMDSCQMIGTLSGSGLTIKNGDGVTIKNCLIDGSPSYGIAIGPFAPYDSGFFVQNVSVTGCTVKHCVTGLTINPNTGGNLANIVVQGTTFASNTRDIDNQASALQAKILP
jgi:Pectate lyase superfamily protein